MFTAGTSPCPWVLIGGDDLRDAAFVQQRGEDAGAGADVESRGSRVAARPARRTAATRSTLLAAHRRETP